MNSITKEITPQILLNNGRLLSAKYSTVYFVEGSFDQKLLVKFDVSDHENIVICNGKGMLDDVLKIYDPLAYDAIFLRDRDFDYICCHSEYPWCVLTDYYDIESNMIGQKTTDSILLSYMSIKHKDKISIDSILHDAKTIGTLRYISFIDCLNLKFEGLKYYKCYDQTTFSKYKLIELVCKQSGKPKLISDLEKKVEIYFDTPDPRNLINSFDFFSLLLYHCSTINSKVKKQYDKQELSRILISNSNKEDYQSFIDKNLSK